MVARAQDAVFPVQRYQREAMFDAMPRGYYVEYRSSNCKGKELEELHAACIQPLAARVLVDARQAERSE